MCVVQGPATRWPLVLLHGPAQAAVVPKVASTLHELRGPSPPLRACAVSTVPSGTSVGGRGSRQPGPQHPKVMRDKSEDDVLVKFRTEDGDAVVVAQDATQTEIEGLCFMLAVTPIVDDEGDPWLPTEISHQFVFEDSPIGATGWLELIATRL